MLNFDVVLLVLPTDSTTGAEYITVSIKIQKEEKMARFAFKPFMGFAASLLLVGCATMKPDIPVDSGSMEPGSHITFKGQRFDLLGSPIAVGDHLPPVALVDAGTMKDINLADELGHILVLSVVPSLDTKVCEAQTHYLAEQGDALPAQVRRIVISRDTPFAQQRFAREGDLTNLRYLSDYKRGAFGLATGLLMDDLMLLARAVLVVDRKGVVRYIQVVPEITHLPDMQEAFAKARQLAER
jgi:thiol peroxidase